MHFRQGLDKWQRIQPGIRRSVRGLENFSYLGWLNELKLLNRESSRLSGEHLQAWRRLCKQQSNRLFSWSTGNRSEVMDSHCDRED